MFIICHSTELLKSFCMLQKHGSACFARAQVCISVGKKSLGLTQFSPRSHLRHLVGIKDSTKRRHQRHHQPQPDLDVFSLLKFRKRTARSHGNKKDGNCKVNAKVVPES